MNKNALLNPLERSTQITGKKHKEEKKIKRLSANGIPITYRGLLLPQVDIFPLRLGEMVPHFLVTRRAEDFLDVTNFGEKEGHIKY